jgi:hypothetical protein
MTAWETWCAGVLNGIGAPINATNVDTLWAWSNAETAPYDLLRWNNPMNTTEPWPGARDSGAQPGAHDVKIYASLQDGIDATVYTLVREPYYSAIVANLRNSLPRQKWGATSTAGAELHAWGTGTNWLTAAPYFGAAPTSLIGANMDQNLTDLGNAFQSGPSFFSKGAWHDLVTGSWGKLNAKLDAILAAVNKPEPVEVEPAAAPVLTPQQSADLATIAGFLRKFGQ